LKNDYKLSIDDDFNNGGSLYVIGNFLVKEYNEVNYFAYEKERNIKFLKLVRVPNTPKIYKLLYKNKIFNGYVMDYIKGSITFREAINYNISYKDKIQSIKDVYKSLKYLHRCNICIGDIHLSNFLYKDGHGYVIDLDEIRFPDDEFKFREYYIVKEYDESRYIKKSNFITDNIKLAITCLSFLFGIDLESIIKRCSLDSIKKFLRGFLDSKTYYYICSVLDMKQLVYLDDVIDNIHINIKKLKL